MMPRSLPPSFSAPRGPAPRFEGGETRMSILMHVHTHVYTHAHAHVRTHVYTHAHTNVYRHVYTPVHTVYTHVYTHVCAHPSAYHCVPGGAGSADDADAEILVTTFWSE